jgi:protein TonB
VITRPDWLSRPDGSDLERYYPDRAREDGVSGRASMRCTVTARGTLTGCRVLSESPAGAGFGAATLRTASRYRMRPQQENGQPVEGGSVTIPVVWQLGE